MKKVNLLKTPAPQGYVCGSVVIDFTKLWSCKAFLKLLHTINMLCICFLISCFSSPEIGPVSITTDPKKFQKDLQELFVQVGTSSEWGKKTIL